jgi:hypothetical protein
MYGPTHDVSTAWTLVSAGSIVGSVNGTASERIASIIGHKQMMVPGEARGAHIYARENTDWNTGGGPSKYQSRKALNGALVAGSSLLPASLEEGHKKRLWVLSFNGSDTITASVYAPNGSIVATVSYAATVGEMTDVGGTVITNLNPCINVSNATYQGGVQEIEAMPIYNRELDGSDISAILAASAALGSTRGRAWS